MCKPLREAPAEEWLMSKPLTEFLLASGAEYMAGNKLNWSSRNLKMTAPHGRLLICFFGGGT